jgi:hypothetical protein
VFYDYCILYSIFGGNEKNKKRHAIFQHTQSHFFYSFFITILYPCRIYNCLSIIYMCKHLFRREEISDARVRGWVAKCFTESKQQSENQQLPFDGSGGSFFLGYFAIVIVNYVYVCITITHFINLNNTAAILLFSFYFILYQNVDDIPIPASAVFQIKQPATMIFRRL